MKGQCGAIKPNGERCQRSAEASHGFCWAHAPEHAEERRRIASRAGKSKGSRGVATLKSELKDLIAKVERGTLEPTRGNTMVRAYGVLIDLIKLERAVYLEEDLARRIEELKRGHREVS